MKKINHGQFLKSSPVSFKKGLLFFSVVFSLLLGFSISGGQEFVYNRIVHPLLFQIRNQTSYAPTFDPRIKLYAVDQKTMNSVNQETIPLKDWTAIFKALAKAKPAAVFIDKSFLLNLTTDKKEIEEFKEALAQLPNVIAGSTFMPNSIQGLTEIPNQRLLKLNSDWPPASKGHFYGPRPEIIDSFTHIGHTIYGDFGYHPAVIRTHDGRAIPHWSFFAGDVKVNNNNIEINGAEIPVDPNGRVLANLAGIESYRKKILSLRSILKRSRNGEAIRELNSESVVIILSGMYAGTNFLKNSPAGTMPGGYMIAEMVNSTIKNSWIKIYGFELIYLSIFCLLGWAAAMFLSTKEFWLGLIVLEALLATFGVSMFVFYNAVVPWALPAAGYFFTAIAVFAERSRVSEAKAKALQYSLEGMIEPQKLEEIMKRPEAFRLEPKSQVLTVMFIDIVGFSSMAERESPAAVFSQLRELLGMAADMVHKSGGVVDRSLGDGLLCFFGYEFQTSNEYTVNHAEAALKCAAEIQRESLKRDFSAVESGLQAFPLRIGINTGEVYAGDLGGGGKIDFTIIGHSVNFAQRLESACENYRVMCGPSTKDFLPAESQLRAELSKKLINIKHHSELIESYEYDPNHNNFEGRQRLKQLCRKLDVGVRDEVRWPVTPKTEILVAGEFGKGQVTNFSFSGLEINADAYIGKGAVINFEFKTPDGSFEAELKRSGITQITAEVRWSWREGEASHRLGLLFKNISPESKDIIFNYIRETSLAKAN